MNPKTANKPLSAYWTNVARLNPLHVSVDDAYKIVNHASGFRLDANPYDEQTVRAWLANARAARGGLDWSQMHHVAQAVVNKGGLDTLRQNNSANRGRTYAFPRDAVAPPQTGLLAQIQPPPDFRRELTKPNLDPVL